MTNSSSDLTFDSGEPPVAFNHCYKDTQRRNFRPLENKNDFRK
jgi:hypothetical protein